MECTKLSTAHSSHMYCFIHCKKILKWPALFWRSISTLHFCPYQGVMFGAMRVHCFLQCGNFECATLTLMKVIRKNLCTSMFSTPKVLEYQGNPKSAKVLEYQLSKYPKKCQSTKVPSKVTKSAKILKYREKWQKVQKYQSSK